MSTGKKVIKKVVKKVAKKPAVRKVTTAAGSEIFDANADTGEEKVPKNAVLVYINGSSQGQVDTTGQKLGEFVIAQAQRHGVRTFSVYVDGRKADTSENNKGLGSVSKVEIVAKDARG
jgi:hypothetical protein